MELPVLWQNDVAFDAHPACELCELHEQATNVGIATVRINPLQSTGLLIIGQNPGLGEDKANRPFIGRSGEMVRDTYIGGMGLHEHVTVYITNVVRCHTTANATPLDSHIKKCARHTAADLDAILHAHSRLYILCLGAVAVKGLHKHILGRKTGFSLKNAISRNGEEISLSSYPTYLFATYHPAAIFRNANYAQPASDHLSMLRDHITGVLSEPSTPTIIPPRNPQ